MYTRHRGGKRVRRRPRRLQQVEADFTRFEIHVGVADGRYEADRGRGKGVRGRNGDGEEPAAVWGGLVGKCLCIVHGLVVGVVKTVERCECG